MRMDYKLMLTENPVLFVHLLTDYLIDKDDSLMDYMCRVDGCMSLQFLSDNEQTEDRCMIACDQDANAFQYVIRKTHKLCIFACRKNGLNIKYVDNDDYLRESLCMIAVNSNPQALEYIDEDRQTLCVCYEAFKQDASVFKYILSHENRSKCLLLRSQYTN